MSDIKCTVDSCHFYGKGNVCTANAIEVNNNVEAASRGTDMEVGKIGELDAGKSEETCCRTYKPRGTEK